ncbi:MAG: hypothetical protein RLZZ28_2687 [Bacteroidota bacterium]
MKTASLLLALMMIFTQSNGQNLNSLFNKARESISGKPGALSNEDIVSGLKEALVLGTEKGTTRLSQVDGFFADAALKILLPPEAKKIEENFRKIGLGRQADDAILSMNRAAEDACKTAAPIFAKAVKEMSIEDAVGILKGADSAATIYLKNKTGRDLTDAFSPVVKSSLQKVDATKYWGVFIANYNRFALQKLNPDLTAYVTEKALAGIFSQIALEEKNIRRDPVARSSEILKKVFGH